MSWDQALDEIRSAGARRDRRRTDQRGDVPRRPARRDDYTERVLKAWGVDGHNSHTNICSSNARIGYQSWMGHDRPSERLRERRGHLHSLVARTSHYFNPAQRIAEGKAKGDGDLRRRPFVEHRGEGRLLAVDLARHRGLPAPH
ncbi:MAG: hypothetical protein R2697_07695 [Ilumatobacteraceae bacterium]